MSIQGLPQRLRLARKKAGFKRLSDAADPLDLTKQNISDYELGRRVPKIERLVEFAKLYNVSTDYLLGLE